MIAEPVWTNYRPFRKARVVLRLELTPVGEAPCQMDILFSAFATASEFEKALTIAPAIDTPPDVLPSSRPIFSLSGDMAHADCRDFAHLFTVSDDLDAFDLVLTPIWLRPEEHPHRLRW